MSTQQAEDGPPSLPPPGVVFQLSPDMVQQCWANISSALEPSEQWSQTFSIANVRDGVGARLMQVWAVMDLAGRRALALTRLNMSPRGRICTVWIIAPQSDDRTICALVDEVETFARMSECAALEIIAHPWLPDRVPGKLTAVIIERDCRRTRRTN